MNCFVVTGTDLGWDCVVGVFMNVSYEELEARFPEGDYVITERTVETSIDTNL